VRTKKNTVVVCALTVAAAVAVGFFVRSPSPKSAALGARVDAMELLGAQIAKLCPKDNVLVFSNPFTKETGYMDEKSRYERAGLRGLRKGLGTRSSVVVVFPEIRPDYLADPQSVIIPPDSSTPLSFLVRASSVSQLADAHPECRVIVSLIGLPVGIERLRIWNEEDPRCFALLLPDLRVIGPPAEAREAFQRGKILAAVVEDLQTGDPLIVTRENVADVLTRQPKALGY
jgi:hypothetical protein